MPRQQGLRVIYRLYRGYIGIMEKKMEAIIMGLGVRVHPYGGLHTSGAFFGGGRGG